ncbi:MAG: NADH-quinone oxidoreductase subunit J [bacterium]
MAELALTDILFYMYATVLIGSAIGVVTASKQVYSALFLVLAFFTASVLWILLEVEYLAITLLVVYVGAVMVLFLFVVMMLDPKTEPRRSQLKLYVPVGLIVAGIMAFEIVTAVIAGKLENLPQPVPRDADYSNIADLGHLLYSKYIFNFEVAAMILLVALIAALTLTLRKRDDVIRVNPSKQLNAKASDRVRIVSMKAETGEKS